MAGMVEHVYYPDGSVGEVAEECPEHGKPSRPGWTVCWDCGVPGRWWSCHVDDCTWRAFDPDHECRSVNR